MFGFWIRSNTQAANNPRKDSDGVRGLRQRSADAARESYDSDHIEDRLRQRQRSAERADSWAGYMAAQNRS